MTISIIKSMVLIYRLLISAHICPQASEGAKTWCNGQVTALLPPAEILSSLYLPDPGWDRRAWHQNLPAAWRRLRRGRGVQGTDQSLEGENAATSDISLSWLRDVSHSGPIHFASLHGIPSYLWPRFSLWVSIFFSQASIPFAVIGSNQLIEVKGKKIRGRLYPWGVVEVENPEHNDFLKLRTMLVWVSFVMQLMA